MKKKLLLYLSKYNCPKNIAISSTLAWLSKSKGYVFDNYYDSYHQGTHFPGGDFRNLKTGLLTGGTVCGDRHFEAFYFMLHNFDVSIISIGESIFSQSIKNLNVPVIAQSDSLSELYRDVFSVLNVSLPLNIVMVGTNFGRGLPDAETYLYPEIYYRQAIGVPDTISDEDLAALYCEGSRIFCFFVDDNKIDRLVNKGYNVEIVDRIYPGDDYLNITERIARRWYETARGWILGDPVLVKHWLPTACEEDLIAIYSIPQEKIVSKLGYMISSKGKIVYGRQYSDRDFFELSKLSQCLQVIDPCRPPFQSVRHVDYSWEFGGSKSGFYENEYSDNELRRFAAEKKILISLMFWSGMIREVENFHNLIDLIAMTGLRCGMVVTAQSYEYMMHPPFELLTAPLNQGGVYPFAEPVLGSCGIGVGIESHMAANRLRENLEEGLSRILRKVGKQEYMPRGWWATMDTDLEHLSWLESSKPIRFLKYPPYMQIRFHLKDETYSENLGSDKKETSKYKKPGYVERVKKFIQDNGLMKYFEPYRPYEFYRAGSIKQDVVEAVKTSGLKYMFTKAGFNTVPRVQYIDDDFIALNYTAGQWDGWTPFETINDVSDLRKAEKKLLKNNMPGWIVGTIDSCLWTFSGEFWKRGSRLFDIARYCAEGGKSGKLVNVKPYTVARYARIMAGNS